MTVQLSRLAADDRLQSAAKYLVVGVISYGIDIGILSLCWRVFGAPLWLATSAGFWGSFAINFMLSRHWTFASRATVGTSRKQFVRYCALVGLNYGITVLAVTGLHHLGLGAILARTLVLAVLTLSTFVLYRRWVFANAPAAVGETREQRG